MQETALQPVWHPPADWRDRTLIGELAGLLGAQDYEDLLAISLTSPSRYWQTVMRHLGFGWRTPPGALSEGGPECPRWFPGGELNWVDNVFRRAQARPADAAAVIAEAEDGQARTLTYRELQALVLRLAGGLAALGIGHGTRVGLMMPMGIPAVSTLLALSALGAIAVPLFSGFGAAAAATRLELAQAQFLVASASYRRRGATVCMAGTLKAIQAQCPGLRLIVDGDGSSVDGPSHAWAELATAAALDGPRCMAAHDPFMIVFTSGTTGRPKGTVHTHGGFPLKILHDCAYHFELRPGDRWLWPSDMGWIVGPISTVGALSRGAGLVCYDGAPDFPGPTRMAELIRRHGVTHFGAAPTLVRSLAASGADFAQEPLESLRVLILAGEVIDPEHFDWFFTSFGRRRLPVINYTGGTEASGALLANVPVRPIKPCGFNSASPGVDAYVGDEAGSRLATGTGELVVGAPFLGMTAGFWGEPERYLESYWTQRPGRWSHGDLVSRDADGHFYVLGRADDTLKIAGKRVGPAEVEAPVLELPEVREAAAVGLPDPVKGQKLVLCIVPRDLPGDGVADAAGRRIEEALGKPFRPARIHIVGQLPKTRNGKIMRRVVRNVLCGLSPGDLSALENPDAIEGLRFLSEKTHPRVG
ncbi:AMP-binding protein [Xenophilus sp.]|uniref:AMP-binding protein n=1 Tax=Xenophilus sp. TaxID=1873499 RepID=UPI0037DDAA82